MICRPLATENCYELAAPLVFWVDYKRQVVPVGFRFKGSIPRGAWTLVTNPYDPRCIRGFCIHDYLYENHVCKRAAADLKLKQVILNDRCPKETAETIYSTVKLCGGAAWELGNA